MPKPTTNEEFITRITALVNSAKDHKIKSLDKFLEALSQGRLGFPAAFGGNTTCSEVGISNDKSVFIDMGSGFKDAGTRAAQKRQKEFHILMTHMHWDHIMGMPFFIPIYQEDSVVNIYHVHKNAPEHIKINFNGINFPLSWKQVSAKVNFIQCTLYKPFSVNGMEATPFALDHPGGSFGYRCEHDGKSIAIGVDGEYKRLTRDELGKDLPFFQNLDLLLFDGQYELSELSSRFDWGHCSPNIGVELALREGIKNLLFTHHDPWSNEEKLYRMYQEAVNFRDSRLEDFKDVWQEQPKGPNLLMAYDGIEVKV